MKHAQDNVSVRRPFPGLRPFEPDEHDLFFGRGDQIDDLLARLEDHRFVAVVGASGSGKSSLVRAGLLPSLDGGFLSDSGTDWRMVIMRPGEDPFSRMAAALHEAIGDDGGDEDANAAAFTEATLRSGPRGLAEAIQDLALPAETSVLVLVDQFEEIFRFRHRRRSRGQAADSGTVYRDDVDRNDATAFVNMLLATTGSELPVYVVLTMRSDFLGDCDAFHGLPEAINDSQFLVPRLRRDQIRDTIIGPLHLFDARAEEGLVNRILNEIGSDPDQLPLMQHLLLRMWTRELQMPGERVLEVSDYVAIGGLEDALSRHADEAYDELGDPGSKRVAELMFRCLCDRSAEARSTRRLVTVAEVAAVAGVGPDKVKDVARVFLRPDRSFLMTSPRGELTPATTLDISHEALIRQWSRLSDWVSREAQSAAKYRRLLETARLWKEGKASLLVSPELDIALDWKDHQRPTKAWASRYGGGFAHSMEFLDSSVAEQHAQTERRQRDARHRKLFLGSILAVVTSLMIAAGFLWLRSRAQATALNEVFIESQLSLGTASIQHGRMGDGLARYWSAYENTTPDQPARRTALSLIASWSHVAGRPLVHDGPVRKVAFSGDGRSVLTVTNNTVRFWDPETGEPRVETITREGDSWQAIAVSPDATTVLVAHNDSAQIHDVRTGMPTGKPFVHGENISTVTFSDDGSTVVTRGEKHTRFWKTQTGEQYGPEWQNKSRAFAISPDGNTFIESVPDSGATAIDLDSGEITTKLRFGTADFLAVSPDGMTGIKIGSSSGSGLEIGMNSDALTRLWFTGSLEPKGTAILHWNIKTVVFSPDSRFVLTGSADNTARIWDTLSGEPIGLPLHHEGTVVAAAFGPDGETVLTGSADNTARLWDVSTGQPLSFPLRHKGTVDSVAFSDDGQTLLTGSVDGVARLWPVHSHKLAEAHQLSATYGSNGETMSLFAFDYGNYFNVRTGELGGGMALGVERAAAFSPDRSMVLTALHNTVYLWDTDSGSERNPEVPNEADSGTIVGGRSLPLRASFPHENEVVAASFGPHGRTILTASGQHVKLWDVQHAASPTHEFQLNSPILAAAISPDGNHIVTGGTDNSARLRDITSVEPVEIRLPHDDDVTAVAFSPDGRLVATGSADDTAAIWDVATGTVVRKPLAHQDAVMDVMFSPDGKTLLTASDDTRVRFWDVASDELRGDPLMLSSQVKIARFDAAGHKVLTLDDGGTARLWDVIPPAADHPERLRLSIEWRSGFGLDSDNRLSRLSQAEWLVRKRKLDALGGPCDVRSWNDLSAAETDELSGSSIRP